MRLILRSIPVFLLAFAGVAAADDLSFTVTSATNVNVGITADSLATIRGNKISTETVSAGLPPWPFSLGDISVVNVTDSTGMQRMASILFVSPSQMNIWIPPGTAAGMGTVSFPVTGLPPGVGAAALRVMPVMIQKTAPGLFSIDGSGTGTAAATAIRVSIPNGQQSPVQVFLCDAPTTCVAVPIDVGLDTPVYLSLYGTGIRGASSLDNVIVNFGDQKVKAVFAGAQPTIPGLDQINVGLPLNLRGAGLLNVSVTVDGVTSNAVQIRIQ